MRLVYLISALLFVTVAYCCGDCDKSKKCSCRCIIEELGKPPKVTTKVCEKDDPKVCTEYCEKKCKEKTSDPDKICYGFSKNDRNGIICVYRNTSKNYEYGKCTNYDNSFAGNGLEGTCKSFCKSGTQPENDIQCQEITKSKEDASNCKSGHCCTCICETDGDGTGKEKQTKGLGKVNKQIPKIKACPSSDANKGSCKAYCIEKCTTETLNPLGNGYGFKKNGKGGVTCYYNKSKPEYENCTNYKNAIPLSAFETSCDNYCKGKQKLPKLDIVCGGPKSAIPNIPIP